MTEQRRDGMERRQDEVGAMPDNRSNSDRRTLTRHYLKYITILKKIPIFDELTVEQFKRILYICSIERFAEGDTVFWEGQDANEMYLLISGEMTVQFRGGNEFTKIIPVGIVGEMGMFTGEPRSATVVAASDCLVLCIRRKELFGLFQKDLTLANHILMNVIADLAGKMRRNNMIIDELRRAKSPGDITVILSRSLNTRPRGNDTDAPPVS